MTEHVCRSICRSICRRSGVFADADSYQLQLAVTHLDFPGSHRLGSCRPHIGFFGLPCSTDPDSFSEQYKDKNLIDAREWKAQIRFIHCQCDTGTGLTLRDNAECVCVDGQIDGSERTAVAKACRFSRFPTAPPRGSLDSESRSQTAEGTRSHAEGNHR